MSAIKHYLFDFDGTLVDSMPAYIRMFLGILDSEGIEYDDDIINVITPLGTVGTANYIIGMGVKLTVDEILEIMKKELLHRYEHDIRTKKNVIETLLALKARGASLNVLTASPHVSLDPCLKNNGIWDLFDNVWSCEDFNMTKGECAIYEKAAEKLGVPPSLVLFADDNLHAVKTASEAGMLTCGVYDDSSKHLIAEIKEVADVYVNDMIELLDYEA